MFMIDIGNLKAIFLAFIAHRPVVSVSLFLIQSSCRRFIFQYFKFKSEFKLLVYSQEETQNTFDHMNRLTEFIFNSSGSNLLLIKYLFNERKKSLYPFYMNSMVDIITVFTDNILAEYIR